MRHVLTFDCLSVPGEQRLPLPCEPSETPHTSDAPSDTVPRVQRHQKLTHRANNTFLNGTVFIKKTFAAPHTKLSVFRISLLPSARWSALFQGAGSKVMKLVDKREFL